MNRGIWPLFLVILVAGAVAQVFLPWWSVAVVAFAAALWLGTHGGWAFLAGFEGVGFVWFALAAWLNVQNQGLLSHRVAQLLPLGGNGWALVVVTAILGGLVGGLAALAGCWVRQAVSPKPVAQPVS
ncbi:MULTISPECIES: hypothetical protein [Hymenobacter]|uniref:Uncharacterized protein n=1 Tax=Hymenobacter jejuensis TaxID=2502781 RepID=A0A5B7ZY30_9BACT|nr:MULTISPECIES: hypothetical protein [Hymenobacter]MBC6991531.1 hypothetical protein [Hymenobacter sp. BT491]QDA59860.1 hypothetical protein FHG12_06945 [Hymenobacter jejuensis]